MKRHYYLSGCFLIAAAFILPCNIKAQVFEEPKTENTSGKPASSINNFSDWLGNPRRTGQQANKPATTESGETTSPAEPQNTQPSKPQEIKKPTDNVNYDTPQFLRPTTDGAKRGHTSMAPVITDEKKQSKEDRFIFVYMADYSTRSTMSGKIMCDIRFMLLSTLDSKINNVSFRLKWPNMETPLSFSEVGPNRETYLDYTLMGDGCYSMDKVPNIIVNRCRIKGMSQKECAEKIRWIKKATRPSRR